MTRGLIVTFLCWLTCTSAVDAQTANRTEPLNMRPSTLDVLGNVPNHLVWLRANLQAVQDPVDGNLVFFDDAGRIVGRVALPPGFWIGKVVSERDRIRLFNVTETRQIEIVRTVDPSQLDRLEASDRAEPRSVVQGAQLVRRSPTRLTLGDGLRARGRAIELRSNAGGTLADAYEIGSDADGNRYVVTEEIVSSQPRLKVRVFVQRFDRNGRRTGIASIPIDGMDVVPRGLATVTDTGTVRMLVPKQQGVTVQELRLRNLGPRSSAPRSLESSSKEIVIDTHTLPVDTPGDFSAPAEPRSRTETPRITRADILAKAQAYLNVNWVMGENNFSKPGIENACVVQEWKHWQRPRQFIRSMIGQSIQHMPYRWGGDDTPESFRRRIAEGALAGDICTCRDERYNQCIVRDAAGVDCSGFVSRAWGISKLGTTGLLNVATPIRNISALRPGDALNWAGHHVRLLVSTKQGAAIVFNVIESATRADCEGVCERSYRASEMNQYQMIRYRGTID